MSVRDVHLPAMMAIIPFLVYLVLIAIAWFALMKLMPAGMTLLRMAGRKIADGITKRGYVDRWLSFLPRSVLKLKPYGSLILVVLIGGGIAFLGGEAFFDVAEELRERSPIMLQIDQTVHEWTQVNRRDFLTPFYLTVTIVGNPLGLTLILLIGLAFALLRRQWSLAAFLVLTSALGALLNRWLKQVFARERPDLMLALSDAAHESFPSGHAMGSVIVLGALAYASLRLTPSWRLKSLWVAVAMVSMLAIAISRIYLGVHWISDIAAGFAAGFSWLFTSIIVYEGYRQVRERQSRTAPDH